MRATGWVINLEELRASPARYNDLRLPEWLAEYPQAWLLVPLWQGKDLLGFVLLASPRTRVEVNWEVIDLLKTAGHQAASIHLEHWHCKETVYDFRRGAAHL